jgi:hypothetical protein
MQVVNLGPITTGIKDAAFNPSTYFNNLSLPPINVGQNTNEAIQSFFETVTDNKTSAQILASAVIFTSASQNTNPMVVLSEFQRMPPGELNQYLTVFLNLNRVGTSLLGLNNNLKTSNPIARTILV